MGRKTMKFDTTRIDMSTLADRAKSFSLVYHDHEDVLFLRPSTPRPAASFDVEGEVWIRFDPETGEIVGLEIDDFEAIFLRKHHELAQAWAEVKPLCHRKTRTQGTDETWECFRLTMLNFFVEFLRQNPPQAELSIVPSHSG